MTETSHSVHSTRWSQYQKSQMYSHRSTWKVNPEKKKKKSRVALFSVISRASHARIFGPCRDSELAIRNFKIDVIHHTNLPILMDPLDARFGAARYSMYYEEFTMYDLITIYKQSIKYSSAYRVTTWTDPALDSFRPWLTD